MHGFSLRHKALACLAALCMVSSVTFVSLRTARAQVAGYFITDLGTLGGTESRAFGINNSGRVVGDSTPLGTTSRHPFIWHEGTMTDIGTLGGSQGDAIAVNGVDYAVGASQTSGDTHAYIWSAVFGKRDLGTLNGGTSVAWDANNSSKVVGTSEIDPFSLSQHAFLWSSSTGMVDLQTLAGPSGSSAAHGINEDGKVVGYSSTPTGQTHAFLYSGGSMSDLGVLGTGTVSIAYEINDEGKVIGYSTISTGGINPPFHAFLWTSGTGMSDLGTLGGNNSIAYDINSRGTVVGFAEIVGGAKRAFVHDAQNGMMDLNTLIPPGTGWVLQEARGINDSGQIVGFGISPSGQTHGYLLTIAIDEIPGGEPPPCSTQAPLPFVQPQAESLSTSAPAPTRQPLPRGRKAIVRPFNPRRVFER